MTQTPESIHPAVAELLVRYAINLDGHDAAGLQACFDEDASFLVDGGPQAQGARDIAEHLLSRVSKSVMHVFTGPTTESLDLDVVIARSYFTALDTTSGAMRSAGICHDEVECSDGIGQARFLKRDVHFRWTAG